MENNISEENSRYQGSDNAIVFDSEPEKSSTASSTWKVVATYLVLNGLVSKVLAVLAHLLFEKTVGAGISIALFLIWDFLVITFALWAGASFAGRYVSRHFIIADKEKAINTIFTFYILFSIAAFFRLLQISGLFLDWKGILITIVETIFSLGLFYLFSKIYVKDQNLSRVGGDKY